MASLPVAMFRGTDRQRCECVAFLPDLATVETDDG